MNHKWLDRALIFSMAGFGFGLNTSISIAQSFFGMSLFIWLADLIYKRRKRIQTSYLEWGNLKTIILAMVLWVIYRLFHVTLSTDPLQELINAREVWLLLIVPMVILGTKKSLGLRFFIWGLLVGGALIGLIALYELYTHDFYYMSFRTSLFNYTHHLTLTGTLGLSLMAGCYFFFKERKELNQSSKILFFILMFLTAGGFVLARSRGGYLAAAIIILFFMIFVMRKWFLVLVPIIMLMPGILIERSKFVNNMLFEAGEARSPWSSFGIRLDLWRGGLNVHKDFPLFGIGDHDLGMFWYKYRTHRAKEFAFHGSHMHNDYFQALVAFGVIGFTIFLLFYLAPLLDLRKKIFHLKLNQLAYDKWPVFFLFASIVMMMVLSLSQCYYTDEEVQMVFWAIVGLNYRFIESSEQFND